MDLKFVYSNGLNVSNNQEGTIYFDKSGKIYVGSNKILDIADFNPLVEITYSDLKALRDGGNLVPGRRYRITDYNTTTFQENTTAAGHQFDIIVTAISASALDENAKAIQHAGDSYFANSNLAAWELKYSLDNDENKYAWCDQFYIVIYNQDGGAPNLYKRNPDADFPESRTDVLYHKTWLCFSGPNSGQGGIYSESENVSINDTLYRSPISSDNPIIVDDVHNKSNIERGVIYYMRDEYNNECPYDFKNIKFTLTDNNVYNKYTFDNNLVDASINTSGVVCNNVVKPYILNNCHTLNKNVFIGISTHNNFLDYNCYNNICTDAVGFTIGKDCFNNTLFGNNLSNFFIKLGNNCYNNTNVGGNTVFGNSCYGNKFYRSGYDYCSKNIFGDNCHDIEFKKVGNCNKFGNDCAYIELYKASFNEFKQECSNINIGKNGDVATNYNIFNNNCKNITIGDGCRNNYFGSNCNHVFIGSYTNSCVFENGCAYVIFGNGITSSSCKDYYTNITIKNNTNYVLLYCTETTSNNSKYRNVIVDYSTNTTSNYTTISDSNVNQTTKTIYQPANTQVISI